MPKKRLSSGTGEFYIPRVSTTSFAPSAQRPSVNPRRRERFLRAEGTAATRAACEAAAGSTRCSRILNLLGGLPGVTLSGMTIKARVREGRLILDEPTDLPEGTEIELLPLDPGDWLDETDRAALHEALRQSDADIAAGRLVDAAEILRELRSR